jgi:mycothiol system anti-sigma-R factor
MKDECRKAIAQAYLYLDGEGLSETERSKIQHHLQECAPCFERVGLDEEVTNLISRLKGANPCPKEVKERITNLLESS